MIGSLIPLTASANAAPLIEKGPLFTGTRNSRIIKIWTHASSTTSLRLIKQQIAKVVPPREVSRQPVTSICWGGGGGGGGGDRWKAAGGWGAIRVNGSVQERKKKHNQRQRSADGSSGCTHTLVAGALLWLFLSTTISNPATLYQRKHIKQAGYFVLPSPKWKNKNNADSFSSRRLSSKYWPAP